MRTGRVTSAPDRMQALRTSFLLCLAIATACTTYGAAREDEPRDDAPADAAAPVPVADATVEDAATTDVGVDEEGGQELPCGTQAPGAEVFCDDFEGPLHIPRAWSTFAERNAKISIKPGDETNPSSVLEVALIPVTDASQRGVLRRTHSLPTGDRWSYRLTFKAKVPTPQSGTQGPRLVTRAKDVDAVGEDDDRLDVGVEFTSAGVKLAYYRMACASLGTCAEPVGLNPYPVDSAWHTYRLELDVEEANASPFGAVRLFVDDRMVISGPLTQPMASLKERATFFGVSHAVSMSSTALLFDDVRIEVVDP